MYCIVGYANVIILLAILKGAHSVPYAQCNFLYLDDIDAS